MVMARRLCDYVQVVSSMDGRYLLNTRVKSVEFSKDTREKQLTVFGRSASGERADLHLAWHRAV